MINQNYTSPPKGTHGGGTSEFYINNKREKNYPKKHPKYNLESVYQLLYNRILPAGRIWTNSDIMTCWRYPTDYKELMKTISDIFNEAEVIRNFYPLPKFDIKYVELPKNTELEWKNDRDYQPNMIINIENYDKYVKDGKLIQSQSNI